MISFLPCQPITGYGNLSLLYALQMHQDEDKRLCLRVVKKAAVLSDRPIFTSMIIDHMIEEILLKQGEDCGDIFLDSDTCKICRVNIIANRIAFETRRGCGNQIIYHRSDAREVLDIFENFCHNYNFHAVSTPAMIGRMMITYKGDRNSCVDGSPIIGFSKDKICFIEDDVFKYVKYFNLKSSPSVKPLRWTIPPLGEVK